MGTVSVVGEGEGDAELKAVPLAFIVVAVEPHSALILYPLSVILCTVAKKLLHLVEKNTCQQYGYGGYTDIFCFILLFLF